jgi:hypothetical protein
MPQRPDGSRAIDQDWKLSETWKGMEAMVKKGLLHSLLWVMQLLSKIYVIGKVRGEPRT